MNLLEAACRVSKDCCPADVGVVAILIEGDALSFLPAGEGDYDVLKIAKLKIAKKL